MESIRSNSLDELKSHLWFIQLLDCCRGNKLKKYKDKIIWIEEFSDKATNYIPDNLDFVYIDGNHQEEYVRLDIESYFDKVCKGGVIGGHDFYNGYARDHDGVVMAVTKYIIENSLTLQVELPDWWIKKL